MEVVGFNKTLKQNMRCNGCGIMIGPGTSCGISYEVRDGPIKGAFHSRMCYSAQVEKLDKKKGDTHENVLNE